MSEHPSIIASRELSEYMDAEYLRPAIDISRAFLRAGFVVSPADITIALKDLPKAEPRHFKVGDLVTCDGTDVQRVIWTDGDDEHAPGCIEVECIKEPMTDELSPVPWIRIGEREHNLARRYGFAGETA